MLHSMSILFLYSTYMYSVQYFWNAWGEWVVLRPSGFIFRPECGSVPR